MHIASASANVSLPVGCEDKGPATGPDCLQGVPQLAPSYRVHACSGLIQEHHWWVSYQGHACT